MSRKVSILFFLLLAGALAACGRASESSVATEAAPPAEVPTTLALPSPTAGVAPTEAPATELPTAEPSPAARATGICPDVPRPALLLFTGTTYELLNPLTGERCTLQLPAHLSGTVVIAGERVYFMGYDPHTRVSLISRLNPDGTIEPLKATSKMTEAIYALKSLSHLMQFAIAPDESRLAWGHISKRQDRNAKGLATTLWFGPADGSGATAAFVNIFGPPDRLATPIRFSGDGQALFFTWQPITGLGGPWYDFNGRYDNLYRLAVSGGQPDKVFDCAELELFLCVGDFRDDGTLAYIDESRTIHVVGPQGTEVATIATDGEYAGYPVFSETGELFYSTLILPDEPSSLLPGPGTLYRVAAPYTDAPEAVISAEGLMTDALPQPFLDADHLVTRYLRGWGWGMALVNAADRKVTRIEPFSEAEVRAIWPAP